MCNHDLKEGGRLISEVAAGQEVATFLSSFYFRRKLRKNLLV